MRRNGSIKLLLKLNAAFMLCLCLLMTFGASAAGTEGLNEIANDVENVEQTATTDPTAAPADALFTAQQAITLVKDSLKADDTWLVEAAGVVTNQGESFYRVVATDPIGDAHCRLVNASTGSISVQSLWNQAHQQEADNQQDESQSGENAGAQDEAQNEEGDNQNDEKSDRRQNDENNAQPDENDQTEVQQEGEFDTSDEQASAGGQSAVSDPPATTEQTNAPAVPSSASNLMQALNAEAECLKHLNQLL